MRHLVIAFASVILLASCDSQSPVEDSGLNISPSSNADAGSSYSNSVGDIWISYQTIPRPLGSGNLSDAIAYLDADADGDTDIFLGTGEYLSQTEVNSFLAVNDGSGIFSPDESAFTNGPPPATHARKSLVADFDGNGLDDVMILDHGFDAQPFPGNQPKLVLQSSSGQFTWSRIEAQTGFHHGGAAGDVDNDGDIDVFVGGFDPILLINDGSGSFTSNSNRFSGSIQKIFSAELIDVDRDGYLDILAGAHERDNDVTSIYWGGSNGNYSDSRRTVIPAAGSFGAVLDFDVVDINSDGLLDIIINRTRDGDDGPGQGFYQGQYTQLLVGSSVRNYDDQSLQRIDVPGGDADNWFPWIRVFDFNSDGNIDFGSDDSGKGYQYLNDGSGNFTRVQG
ncbi:MAG: VCBS repeat-containing protein [Rhodothermales bacterium]|nr:VCBS repeat-containing protein [Rhodothermales bacterium]